VTSEPTDADLVARMTSGDREAFAALFRRHQPTVYRFSKQMLGSREAAEDVTQEVFIALAQTRKRFDPAIGSLTTYLYGITRNLVLQRHKRSRSRIEVDIESLESHDEPALATSMDPVDNLSRAQKIRQLRMAIVRLPLHYREVIVLCELNALSYEDAAAIAGCPVGTVRSRLSRARHMLIERCQAFLGAEKESEVWRKCLIPTKNGC
jgi:RNA polymerase sigma-70 factor (ECF subfamily)